MDFPTTIGLIDKRKNHSSCFPNNKKIYIILRYTSFRFLEGFALKCCPSSFFTVKTLHRAVIFFWKIYALEILYICFLFLKCFSFVILLYVFLIGEGFSSTKTFDINNYSIRRKSNSEEFIRKSYFSEICELWWSF